MNSKNNESQLLDNIDKDYILFVNGSEIPFDNAKSALHFSATFCANCKKIITGKGIEMGRRIYCSPQCASPNQQSLKYFSSAL